jgi:hypothetical protein
MLGNPLRCNTIGKGNYLALFRHLNSKMDLELRKKLSKCYIWSIALYGAKTGTLRTVDQKNLESFEMRCCRRILTSEGGSYRSHYEESWLWKRLWICHETDC